MSKFRTASILVIHIFAACSGAGQKPPAPVVNGVILNPVLQKDKNCPNGSLLTYENFGEGFMLANCTQCHARDLLAENRHGAPEFLNLDEPDDIAQWRSMILKVAAAGGNNSMPPSFQTSAGDRSRLAEWLNCGGSADRDSVLGSSQR